MVETKLDFGGAVVYWTASEFTDREKLRAELTRLGLDNLLPDPRPDSAVLRDALEEVLAGPRVLIRPLADRDGFAVVTEERGKQGNNYSTNLLARVSDGGLDFDPYDERANLVIAAYRKHGGRIPSSQLSAFLVKAVESLGGTRLRPSGSVYWIPGPKMDDWSDIAKAVESAADGRPSAVYLLRHRLDADAVRAVRDAVVNEVTTDAEKLMEDVSTGDLGQRALESRKRQAGELRKKVNLYEDLLSVGLANLHAALDSAEQAAAVASLLLSSQVEPSHYRSDLVGA